MLKILGRVNSSNVMKVLWTCAELNLPYEREDVGGEFGGNDTPEYLTLNPNGRVPTVIDGNLVLWESNAIVRYLAAKHDAGGLWPTDVAERADLDRWMDWQQTVLSPAFRDVFWGLVRTPPENRDQAAIAAAVRASGDAFRMLDARLQDRAFIGGDRLTMADIPMCGFVHRWYGIDIPDRPDDMPSLRAWYERLCLRPAFRTHVTDIPIT
ncbi:MAG TPA: glutathione S-transferase family protein [Alphaproteobacteria bacterium]|nr:glutathione S-transferase family protein [Alphaproteobacteria bacterium]